jgi:hypothetical protein
MTTKDYAFLETEQSWHGVAVGLDENICALEEPGMECTPKP